MANHITLSRREFAIDSNKGISYIEGGPSEGPLFIFLHGWPAIAQAWEPQLVTFAELGFRVVAPDMPGYGRSYKSKNRADFSLEAINASLTAFVKHLGRSQAIWAGHDWGAGVLWSYVAHHPETCIGVITMCVPYRTVELGPEEGLFSHINRDMYHEEEYPFGQWDYQKFYLTQSGFDKAIQDFEADIPAFIRAIWSVGQEHDTKKPAFTAFISKNNGWLGGEAKPPNIAREHTLLHDKERLYDHLVEAYSQGGFWAPTAYYINQDENFEYASRSVNEGIVTVPTLFMEAKWDFVCDTAISTLAEPMRKYCKNHTEVSIATGHWLPYQAPEETNAAIAKWILTNLRDIWPYETISPLKKMST